MPLLPWMRNGQDNGPRQPMRHWQEVRFGDHYMGSPLLSKTVLKRLDFGQPAVTRNCSTTFHSRMQQPLPAFEPQERSFWVKPICPFWLQIYKQFLTSDAQTTQEIYPAPLEAAVVEVQPQ